MTNQSEQSAKNAHSFDEQLNEILAGYDNWCPCTNHECQEAMNYSEAKAAIKQLVADEMRELIGEDARNDLRQDLRTKVAEWLGEESK